MNSPRFLIFRGGAIGDFIATLPALAAVRRQWPDAYIELAGYPHIANLALAGGMVDRVISLENAEAAQYFSLKPSFSAAQTAHLQSFDVVISYLHDPSGVVRANLVAAGAPQVICGSPLVESGHITDHLMKPLATLAIFAERIEYPRLRLDRARMQAGKTRLGRIGERVVALHPGSGSPAKNWPLARFVDLARRIKAETAWTPMFTLGEADHAIAAVLPTVARDIPVLPPCDLLDLAAALSACAGYVGNDSGITHIAAALGIPVVCVYGPTDPERWAPRGPNARVIAARERTSESLTAIGVDQVFDALRLAGGQIAMSHS